MEGLQLYARLHLAQAMGESMEGMDEHFTGIAKDSAQSIADTAGESFHTYDDAAVRQFVGVAWSDGEGYSDKLWADASKVASYVQQDLVDGIVRGASYTELCRQMQQRFGQSEYNTMRVVRTEGTYVSRQAQVATMEQVGIDTYRIATERDNRTCGRCHRVEDAGEIPLSKRVVGENFPPLHPNCRCQINVGPDVDEWLRRRRAERRSGTSQQARASAPTLGKRFGSVEGLPPTEVVEGVRFDASNPADVRRFVKRFSDEIRGEPVEHAYVLQADGTVRHAIGTVDAVSLEGAEMTGATVVHNHLMESGAAVSLSRDDFAVLCEHQDASLYIAVSGNVEFSMRATSKLRESMYDECYRALTFDEMQSGELNDLVMRKLHERGYIDYRRREVRSRRTSAGHA